MKNTTIAWTDHTFNPWRGCEKVSPGCAHCYAETMSKRNPKVLGEWGPTGKRVLASDAAWKEVERWNRKAREPVAVNYGQTDDLGNPAMAFYRPLVFCASMADWLDPRVPVEWLARLLDLIRRTSNLDWLLLTKRPEQWRPRLYDCIWREEGLDPDYDSHEYETKTVLGGLIDSWLHGAPPTNVWFGVSAEDQQRWDERVPILLSIPARVRFVSVEPMLEAIRMFDVDGVVSQRMQEQNPRETLWPADLIDWVIFGGESGPRARPCNVDWIRGGVRQCRDAGVKAFVKQVGARPYGEGFGLIPSPRRDHKGGDMAEWPEDLRVREWPEVGR